MTAVVCGAVLTVACHGRAPLVGYGTSPEVASVERSVFFVGGASEPEDLSMPVRAAVSRQIANAAGPATVVLLGSEAHAHGVRVLTGDRWQYETRALDDSLGVAHPPAAVLESLAFSHRSAPNPCPAPIVQELGEHLRLVLTDTEWWLGERTAVWDLSCGAQPLDDYVRRLRDAVHGHGDRQVVVVGHHPLVSSGRHAGVFSPGDHLFPFRRLNARLWLPLPLLGTVAVVIRQWGASVHDLAHPRYQQMIAAWREAFVGTRPSLVVGGHEQQLAVFRGHELDAGLVLVSGTGVRGATGRSRPLPTTRVSFNQMGFMRLDVLRGLHSRLHITGVADDGSTRDLAVLRVD